MQLLSAVIAVACFGLLCQASLSSPRATPDAPKSISNGENDDLIEDEDFKDFEDEEEDEDDGILGEDEIVTQRVESLTHIHRKNGEILVPCFGMWWPVGASRPAPPVYYDYGEEYYDDYGRRRRRAKKRRAKKAKMRKRKKAKV